MKKGIELKRSDLVVYGLIIALVGFVIGTRSDTIFAHVGQALGMNIETGTLDLSSVQETYQQLKANYDGDVDQDELVYGASRGVVAAVGDAHTVFMDPEEAAEFEKSMNGDIGGGVGAEIGLRNKRPTIIRLLDDSPAKDAGVKVNDIIVSVNEQSVSGQTVDQVVEKIRGEIGTSVKLGLLRGEESVTISVTRRQITSPTVESKIDGNVGILTVHMFNDETGSLARSAAESFVEKGVTKVILDLRGNGGGTVTAAQSLAGLWLDKQTLMTERSNGKDDQTVKTTGKPILGDIKTVVLINGGSASASEIVAGALSEYEKATLVGEKSYGKGSVQAVIQLDSGAILKVTTARWYTPKGATIDGKGIEPTEKVELTADDFDAGRDPQMDKAKEL